MSGHLHLSSGTKEESDHSRLKAQTEVLEQSEQSLLDMPKARDIYWMQQDSQN